MYSINQSPLYRLRSKRKLAALLGSESVGSLIRLAARGQFKIYTISKDGKERQIEEPRGLLRGAHNKLSALLRRIHVPDYLHSGVKKRSNVTNASEHDGSSNLLVTDISKFYPSTSYERVFRLFKHHFKCEGDVAKLLADLCCCNGHVPTGSSLSMALAYWANVNMFDELNQLSKKHNVIMTVYVDDLTFSGQHVNRLFRSTVLKVIRRHGLNAHRQKTKMYSTHEPKLVTGVIVAPQGLKVRNKHHQQMYEDMRNWEILEEQGALPRELLQRLSGRMNAMASIDKRYKDKARTLMQSSQRIKLL